MFFWFVCLFFFASFKTLLIQMDFHQNIDKGFSCIHHIIKNLELEIDFIIKDKFQNISKKSPFSFKHSKIYKFLFLRASFVCLSCYT